MVERAIAIGLVTVKKRRVLDATSGCRGRKSLGTRLDAEQAFG
jgi:hypothetical protein